MWLMFGMNFSQLAFKHHARKGRKHEENTLDVIPGNLHLLGRNDDTNLGG